jgi:hypothetical protein
MKKLLFLLCTFTFSLFTSLCNAQVKDIVNFAFGSPTPGAYPYGSLLRVGDVLYGMTQNGGSNNGGLIFSVDTYLLVSSCSQIHGYSIGICTVVRTLFCRPSLHYVTDDGDIFFTRLFIHNNKICL